MNSTSVCKKQLVNIWKDLSQYQKDCLVNLTGSSEDYIRQVLRGNKKPSCEKAVLICAYISNELDVHITPQHFIPNVFTSGMFPKGCYQGVEYSVERAA